jgi:hypothetical protein
LDGLSFSCNFTGKKQMVRLMKKRILSGILIPILLTSCLDADRPNINGLWQLKAIETAGQTVPVDTIYYSFQSKQEGFLYTVLHENSGLFDQTETYYGYVDFPSKSQIHILMDADHHWEEPLAALLWHDTEVTYDILKLSSKEMVLKQKEKEERYQFIKF